MNISSDLWLNWITEAKKLAKQGTLPDYIPKLKKTNPEEFSLCFLGLEDDYYHLGNQEISIPLMSVVKIFLVFYLLHQIGEKTVFQKVGNLPSDYPFNSLEQLQIDKGFPRNPMINSGAIMLASLLEGETALSRCEKLQQWLNEQSNCQLFLDTKMWESIQANPNPKNQDLVNYLAQKNSLKCPEITLETYNAICCLSGTILEIAKLGLLLLKSPRPLQPSYSLIVQDILLKSGLYEASETFAKDIGFPTKSGVNGIILSIIPHQGAIAIYSPPLDTKGNSLAGLYLLKKLRQKNVW